MAEETQENQIQMEFTGTSGDVAYDIAPYNHGRSSLENGDVVEVPESLALRMSFSSDWRRVDGQAFDTDATEEEVEQEEAAANRTVSQAPEVEPGPGPAEEQEEGSPADSENENEGG